MEAIITERAHIVKRPVTGHRIAVLTLSARSKTGEGRFRKQRLVRVVAFVLLTRWFSE